MLSISIGFYIHLQISFACLIQGRWTKVHGTAIEWVTSMTTLVECWNKLEGNVDELSSWVDGDNIAKKDVIGNDNDISIEKLEGQLTQLKTMFAEKQKLVNSLEAYGPSEIDSTDHHDVQESGVQGDSVEGESANT